MNFNAHALQLGVDVYQNEEQGGSKSYVGPLSLLVALMQIPPARVAASLPVALTVCRPIHWVYMTPILQAMAYMWMPLLKALAT